MIFNLGEVQCQLSKGWHSTVLPGEECGEMKKRKEIWSESGFQRFDEGI